MEKMDNKSSSSQHRREKEGEMEAIPDPDVKIKVEKIDPKEEPKLERGSEKVEVADEKDATLTHHEANLTHRDAMAKFKDGLVDIIGNDPLLHDLPPAVTLEEVNSQIALEYGQAMTVNVHRDDGLVLPIVVVSSATVLDLKNAIRRHMTLKLERMGHTAIVSWRYIWKRYCLIFEGQKLLEDTKPIKEYGIRNRDKVTFMKVLRHK